MDEREELMFYLPVIEEDDKEAGNFHLESANIKKAFPLSLDKIQELVKDMTDYELATIELHVTGIVKSGPITELFIGVEGEAGMKLILNKKKEI
ncbi:hypothetical protein [Planococcus faecalis]|uniref:Uncharacterized protein n=1 Tax=Planococcus faecalis TaxID=1598147 RepID=A0ABM6ITN1_9BACL|nr:hypothetical protein [Planococcus faecalis]AQU79685.1 hypothetical protein AJGP001_10610 [Planococcus faecalis]OHX51601.1 hypothetical protein BB777_16525 [Planococcus faecalis]